MVDHAPQPHLSPESDEQRQTRIARLKKEIATYEAKRVKKAELIMWAVTVVFVVGLFVLLTWPIPHGGGEAKSSEARAALGTIKDRLRTKFLDNKNTVNITWTLSDLVNSTDVNGKWYAWPDYSLLSLTTNTAIFRAAANVNTTAPQVTMRITNIQTGEATITSP